MDVKLVVIQTQNNRIFTHVLQWQQLHVLRYVVLMISWEKGVYVKWWAGRDDFNSS